MSLLGSPEDAGPFIRGVGATLELLSQLGMQNPALGSKHPNNPRTPCPRAIRIPRRQDCTFCPRTSSLVGPPLSANHLVFQQDSCITPSNIVCSHQHEEGQKDKESLSPPEWGSGQSWGAWPSALAPGLGARRWRRTVGLALPSSAWIVRPYRQSGRPRRVFFDLGIPERPRQGTQKWKPISAVMARGVT